MQELFVLRHGVAEDIKDCQEKDDFHRKLTKEGREKTKQLSLFFDKLREEVSIVLSSPYLRAKETAEIFVNNISPKPDLQIVDFLSCGVTSREIVKGLMPYSTFKKIVIVGHAPDLEMFLGKLISSERIKLKKGAIAKVTLNDTIELAGELEWLITPNLVKKAIMI